MRSPDRRTVRAVALAVLLAGSAFVAASALADEGPSRDRLEPADAPAPPAGRADGDVRTAPIPAGANLTVVATQGFYVSDERAELMAFTRSGRVVYHDDRYRTYFDVDPVPGTRYTVEYVAARHRGDDACDAFETEWCTEDVVERANLSTGAVERVWTDRTAGIHGTRHHDVDRLNATHLVVADIDEDRVVVVDARDGSEAWSWSAAAVYDDDQGGRPGDWTHVNDVEALPDGRVMVSFRNMDEVVFLRPGEGVDADWTLGADDDHAVLFEQHNPDFIPAQRGGPAVVVADSENRRVVEYRRVDGGWEPAWTWRDFRLQWPRDADRLPGGNTLVVDSHGDRVLEVTPAGAVAWSVTVGMPYDAERLGTGDESAGGPAIDRAGDGGSADPATAPWYARPLLLLKDLLPSVALNSLLYVAPEGVRFVDLLVAAVVAVDLLAWGGLELRWSRFSLRRVGARIRRRLARGRA